MGNLLIVGVLSSVLGISAEVRPLSGRSFQGELIGLAPEAVVIQTGGGQQKLAVAELWEIILQADEAPPDGFDEPLAAWVELVDGSRLCAVQFTTANGMAAIRLPKHQDVSVPTSAIRAVRLRDHADTPHLARQWQGILAEKSAGDVIVIRRTENLDQLEGMVHDVTHEIVRFEFDGQTVDVNREKLEGFVYYHPVTRDLPDRLCQLTDAAGSCWNVQSIQWNDDRIEATTVAGVRFSLPVAELRRLDFSSGNTVWLSDLEPESVQWDAFFRSPLPQPRKFYLRKDVGLAGEPLLLDGRVYGKGLSIRSRTELVYRLAEGFRQFHATVGIDDRVRNGGNVDLVISGDDRVLLRKNVTGDDPSFPVDLDITQVRRLKILVDFGQESDVADHLDLCNARLTK